MALPPIKLTFTKLGPIDKAKLELRPLTVVIGANNTGKTYLAYATYGAVGQMRQELSHFAALLPAASRLPARMGMAVAAALRPIPAAVGLGSKDLARVFQDTSGRIFDGGRVLATFDLDHRRTEASVLRRLARLGPGQVLPDVGAERARAALQLAILGSAPAPFLLPAERSAFVVTYKLLANRRYRVLRSQLRDADSRQRALLREQGDFRYPSPLEDFLDFLSDVELGLFPDASSMRPERGEVAFPDLATIVESGLQGGQRLAFQSTALGGKELKVELGDGRFIDLYNASSSIKQLAPLVLYLRHRAAEGDLLIIDEPEMNLHPEGQARLLEVLAILANLGVYVLVTTHSPYLLAHLNNLIASTTKSPAVKKRQAESLYLGDKRAFSSADQVSAYEMRDGTLHDLHDADFGIRWDTLSDVSVDLQQRYFAIREAETSPRGRAKKA